jgi:para-nitrobenzyl esterase
MSVSLLQASPLAKGLFAKAVAMSGSAFGGMLGPIPLAKAEEQGVALQKELGARSLTEMRALPGDRIIAATTPRSPIVRDGKVVTGSNDEVFAARQQSDVPLLIGYTRDESFQPFPPTVEATTVVRQRYPVTADAILKAYASSGPRIAADIARDGTVGLQMAQWAQAQRKVGKAPVYAYLFTRRQPYAPGITFSDHDPARVGAYHTGDVPYWLGTRDALNLFRPTRIWEPADQSLEDEMTSALLAFSRTGVPQSPRLGTWPASSAMHPRLTLLGEKPAVVPWPHFPDFGLFTGVLPQTRPASDHSRD